MLKKYILLFIVILFFSTVVEATTYYGQILIKNSPVQGLEVSAEWIDQKGIYHRTSTKTLTREQAIRRGDSQFEGYYFFEGGSVYPQENTNVVFSFSTFPYNLIVRALPGQAVVKLNTVSFQYVSSYSNVSVEANKTEADDSNSQEEIKQMILINSTGIVVLENMTSVSDSNISTPISGEEIVNNITAPENKGSEVQEKKTNPLKELFLILVLVVILGFALGIGYLFIKQGTIYIGNTIDDLAKTQKPKKIAETKIKNITNTLSFISLKEDISQAVSLVSTSQDNIVVVIKDGEYYGYIKEKDLIVYQGEYNKKISECPNLIYRDNLIIDANKRINEAFSLMDEFGVTALVVKEKNKIIGQASGIDILKLFSSIKFSEAEKEKQDLLLVRDILEKSCPCVNKDTTVKEIAKIISEQNTDLVIIQNERYIGELTSDDLLSGIIKYGQNFKDSKVGQVMSSIHSLNPDADIYDACDYVIERGFSSYPVIINDTLLGIVKPMRLLKEVIKDSK